MANFQSKIEEILQCPVCFLIPRELPISSCSSGHIVCRGCRRNTQKCPTCRGQLTCTNTVAGYMVQVVQHKCTFYVFDCPVTTSLNDIRNHEKICEKRTVVCPYKDCGRDINLANFESHAVDRECALDLNEINRDHFFEGKCVQFHKLQL